MTWGELLLLAMGVGMDAMTAAIAVGLTAAYGNRAVRVSVCFAASHAVMPLVGWLTVGSVALSLARISGPVIAVLLSVLGIGRLIEAFHYRMGERPTAHLLLTAFATGLDATTVGVTMALSPPTGVLALPLGGPLGCVVTAAVTFVMCLFGVTVGHRAGTRFGRSALFAGGLLLLLLAICALVS